MTRAGRLASVALGLSLAVAIPNAAVAGERRTAERFAAAVVTCEDRNARATVGELRTCVRGLAIPESTEAEIMDLWSIFMYCLGFMSESGLDAMYPPDYYEDLVNDCLGL